MDTVMGAFTVIDAAQRSPEWFDARAGRLTGSRADAILMSGRKKGEESKTRRDYRLQLVAERFDPREAETHIWTADMQRGVDLEFLAFGMYEALTGAMVRKTGFLSHNEIMAGCSLDGDINGFSGIIELKCPKMATHLAYIANPKTLVSDYVAQVTHNLWISGAAFCDLISFDNRVPQPKQLLRVRVERYDVDIPAYEVAALAFLAEVETQYAQLWDDVYV